jgi:hypothetical protein
MGLPAGVLLKLNPAIVVDVEETAADTLARSAGTDGTGGGEPMTRELG